jgi:hypothetical protein
MDEEADGLKIVLTPVQMAAIMVGDNIPEQATLTHRLWGTAKTVGGVLELMGAAALEGARRDGVLWSCRE